MFERILIANRGEIACRIIKTARQMGISTVAVYSDADKDALHVSLADTSIRIGPAPSAESYLVIDKIIAVCKATGAEAVHPGYGFLSEREAFPLALEKSGIVFIGPNPKAIAAMGDKIESKKAAAAAKVSTVPGSVDTRLYFSLQVFTTVAPSKWLIPVIVPVPFSGSTFALILKSSPLPASGIASVLQKVSRASPSCAGFAVESIAAPS